MPYSITITKNARRDIQDAIDWENKRSVNLADRLLTYIDEKLITISRSPHIFAVRYENVRCAGTKVFPYLIHYIEDDINQQIIILRILHTSRRPIW